MVSNFPIPFVKVLHVLVFDMRQLLVTYFIYMEITEPNRLIFFFFLVYGHKELIAADYNSCLKILCVSLF
jgi:hypothetical protein